MDFFLKKMKKKKKKKKERKKEKIERRMTASVLKQDLTHKRLKRKLFIRTRQNQHCFRFVTGFVLP